MALADQETASVLPYASFVYKRHKPDIDKVAKEARKLRWILTTTESKIFGATGIVCDRARGDTDPSVSKMYFQCALDLLTQEANSGITHVVARQREMVEEVLALRLSITCEEAFPPHESAPTPFAAYKELISEFEEFCADSGIPSLLPNLYLPSSLASRLNEGDAYKSQKPHVFTMFQKLTDLCAGSAKHLHVVVHHFVRQKRFDEALSLLEQACDLMGTSAREMSANNEVLMETYVEILFQRGEYETIVEEMSAFIQMPSCKTSVREKYIQALVKKQRVDDFMAFTQTEAATAMLQNSGSRLFLISACVDLGWILYGNGECQKILDMIQPLSSVDARVLDHKDIKPLMEQAQEMLDLDSAE